MSGWGVAALCALLVGGLTVVLAAANRSKMPPLETPVDLSGSRPRFPRGYFILLGVEYGAFALVFLLALVGAPPGAMAAFFFAGMSVAIVRMWLRQTRWRRWQRERRARWEEQRGDSDVLGAEPGHVDGVARRRSEQRHPPP